MKKEEDEINLSMVKEQATILDKFYDSYLVNEWGKELGDAYMNNKEKYGSGNEKLIFWKVAFSKLKWNPTNQWHHIKQMFSKLCAHCSQMVHSHSDYSKYAIVHDMNSAVTTPNYVSATPLDVDNKIYLQNVHWCARPPSRTMRTMRQARDAQGDDRD